jgi:hypothetical protein
MVSTCAEPPKRRNYARIIGRGWRVKRDDLDAYVRKL